MMKSIFTLFLFCIIALCGYGQTTLKGKVVDSKTNEPLIGATILIKGTTSGISTSLDGDFSFVTDATGTQKAIVSSMGYTAKEIDLTLKGGETDLGNIALENGAVGLNEVMVIASMAIDRKTPVAVSTISAAKIEEKLGNDEFPEILRQTPGVYATKQGGAFGDGRVNIRGFDTRNIAVMINGVPVNDMEGGTVYWSNWAGMADVTRSMQVQRGLGAAQIAVPSVGGTINIATNTTDAQRGGNIFTTVGNDNMLKYGATFSSGLSKNNWATSFLLAKNTGNGYANATQYEAYSYFFNLSKRINNKHTLAFSVFGAPQWHNQRAYQIADSNYQKYGLRYNDQWGYKDGQVLSIKKNFYHKPEAALNHFWKISDNTSVNSAIYFSTGTGGGTGAANSIGSADRTNDGLINFTKIVNNNIALGNQGSSNIIKASVNNHIWYGLVSSIKHTINNLSLSGGIDARSYVGKHYQTVTDLLGGQFFIDKIGTSNGNYNNPNNAVGLNDKLGYNYDGVVRWYGIFGQAEYAVNQLTLVASASVSDKWYQRIDRYSYFADDVISSINNDPTVKAKYIAALGQSYFNRAMAGQKSEVATFIGYSVKGGANYNLNQSSNIFFNTGYFQRQPDFTTVYPNYLNLKNSDSKNEKIFSAELGYGYRSSFLTANLNIYSTSWKDKTLYASSTGADGLTYFANIAGVNALHNGIELDFVAKPFSNLKINGTATLGDWEWKNNIDSVHIYDQNQTAIGKPVSLFIKNVHVGNSAQTVLGLGADYEFMKGFSVGANYTYFDRLYAYFDPAKRTSDMGDAWKMPAYGLLDINMKYDFLMGTLNSSFFVNVHNALNTKYFSDGTDQTIKTQHDYMSAAVYYGLGTTWSVGLKMRF